MNFLEINRELWDAKTDVHVKSRFYDVESFLQGKNSLKEIELDLLGDVSGKSILHLQCHFGMDSISLSRMGARVTGVDFSGKSISFARDLAQQTGTDTRFMECDVYSLSSILQDTFDIVFTSYGVIGWLPDVDRWAHVVSSFLNPTGQFVFVEFHPVVWMFSYDFKRIAYSYFNTGAIQEEIEGTYADRSACIKNKSVSWNHSISEVLSALLTHNLTIRDFREYDYSPYDCFDKTVRMGPDRYQIPGLEKKLPLVYGLKAVKNVG